MAQLSTTQSFSQTTTQSPQSAPEPSAGAQSSSVQPGTATDLLRSNVGISLTNTPVSIVNLHPATASNAPASSQPFHKHHVNAALLGFSILLIVVAIALFWVSGRSVKTTT